MYKMTLYFQLAYQHPNNNTWQISNIEEKQKKREKNAELFIVFFIKHINLE